MKVRRMRLTIERLRTLILAAGVLLIAALGVFLVLARYRNPLKGRDIPKRLGLNIQEEANGIVFSHEVRGHTLYKFHASKQVQLKKGDQVLLQFHDVQIELYGEDGSRVDRISGDEFEYDPGAGVARAAGPVEITIMRPDMAPAIAPKAAAKDALGAEPAGNALASAAETAARGEIHVKTSGLSFDRNTGEATTNESVQFELAQASGSAVGAAFASQAGRLVLDHAVELTTSKGAQTVRLHADHAELERGDQVCRMRAAAAQYRQGEARAVEANVFFRDDGSAERLEADKGITLTTSTGGRLEAPKGTLNFDERNQPKHGHLEGGVTIDSEREGRKIHGSSPTMEVEFVGAGELHSAHLERGVRITSDETATSQGEPMRTQRLWVSPVVDVAFRKLGKGKVEPAQIHGTGGVAVTAESQRGSGPASPSRMTADDVIGTFGPNGSISGMTGTGHASIVQTTLSGTRQTTSGDKIVAQFGAGQVAKQAKNGQRPALSGTQIQSATVDGNVVLVQEPAPRAGSAASPAMRATAGRAVYEGTGEWLHLTLAPHVTDGGLEFAADKIDVSQASGDAFGHGDVKASYLDTGAGRNGQQAKAPGGQAGTFGAQGPAHAVSSEAQLRQATGEAAFQGKARLWQQGNSISAPLIVLDRAKQTLAARSESASEPVQVVLVSAAPPNTAGRQTTNKTATPSVIRVRGGDLKYSSAERKAVMHGGSAGSVVAATGDATTVSNELELILLPPGNHAGKDGAAAQVDRMTAQGHVIVTSQGRRGTGEKLVYTGETESYVLTGTAGALPQMTDSARGSVTGEALIFNGHDDSVRIEGGGRKTTTVTTAPK
jgi:lipopolysaccharide export system protein LptA